MTSLPWSSPRGAGAGWPFAERVAELRRRCEEAGRAPVPITAFSWGRAEEAEVEEHARLGVERVIVPLPPVGRDRALRSLERYAPLVERYA